MKFSRLVSRFLIPGALIAVSFVSSAQQTNAPARPRQRPPGIMENPGINGFALGGPVGVLTDEQRTSYETALNRQRGLMVELQAKLRAARQDFVETSVDQKFDENVLLQKAMVAAHIEAEMAVLRARAMSEVQPPLTAEQIQKIKTGQPGQVRPLRQGERPFQRPGPATIVGTNLDVNGLPPKK
jgi:Spy/CpxP family protein refolding chaperone